MKKLIAILFLSMIFQFAFVYQLNPPAGNWYQQFMPNLNGAQIVDITFTDSLTGYAITNLNPSNTSYFLKTSNGGDNWFAVLTDTNTPGGIDFINSYTGFIARGFVSSNEMIFKTTNGGINWLTISMPEEGIAMDIEALNSDTLWVADPAPLNIGGLYWTTNSGASWQRLYAGGNNNPEKIYMFNPRIGFMTLSNGGLLYKTTNGGSNWFTVSGGPWTDIYFIDSLTGWKANGDMKKTTDGGLNWVTQTLPYGGMIETPGLNSFSNLNKDTIWASGGFIRFPNNQLRMYLHRTTNGGDTWYFQIPDTSIIMYYTYVNFVSKFSGWATSRLNPSEIHTTRGGDTTFYLGVQQVSNKIPKLYELSQNFPNPFNPRTVIRYKLKSPGYVRLIAYDILGKEVQLLVNQKQEAGEYEVDFIGKFTASGVYFYRIEVMIERSKRVFSETKKMILIK